MLNSILQEEKTGNYTKRNSYESVDFKVIVDLFIFDVFYREKSVNISVFVPVTQLT